MRQSSKKRSIFGSKKTWEQDPDLNDALERITNLERDYDQAEKERSLYQLESQQLKKENKDLDDALSKEIKLHESLEQLKIDQEHQIKE